MSHIGDKIKQIRISKGLTRSQIKEMANITPQLLYNIERGGCVISPACLRRFARATRTSYTKLVDLAVKDYRRRYE